jgi:hemerythrin
MFLKFDETLLTGIDNLDNQHKEMCNLINKLFYAMADLSNTKDILKCLDFLEKFLINHLNEEEAIQKQHKYPKFNKHHTQHEELKSELINLKNIFEMTAVSPLFVISVNKKMLKLCTKHILTGDKEFGKFLLEKYRPTMDLDFKKSI